MQVFGKAKAVFTVINDGMDIKQAQVYLKETAKIGREERKRIYQLLGLTTVTNGQTKANIGLTASLKTVTGGILKMAAAWVSSPLGIGTLAVTGIYAIIKAYDHLSSASERAIEKHKELSSEYNETESEIESLEEQIDSTNAKIKELESAESPELVSQTEISKLETSVELMKKQLEIKKKLLAFEDSEKTEAAASALTKRDLRLSGEGYINDSGSYIPTFEYKSILDQVESYQSEYAEIEKMLVQSYNELANLEPGTNLYENLELSISNLEERKNTLEQDIEDSWDI